MKKLWIMEVTIKPIVIGALGTVTKGLVQGLEDLEIMGQEETVQTTALLRLTSGKLSANAVVKNSHIVK